MQELLLRKCLVKELPQSVAEDELREAQKKLQEDRQDVTIIKHWHTSRIQRAMTSLDVYKGSRQGVVSFCKGRSSDKVEQSVCRIVEEKPSLIAAWYVGKCGLSNVRFERSKVLRQYGNEYNMSFSFGSKEVEARLTHELMADSRAYSVNANLSLALLRPKLPARLIEIVKQFMPEYVLHLKQEKLRLEKASRW